MNTRKHLEDSGLGDPLGKPDLFLWQFDGDEALFVRMDRGAYRDSIFLDQRIRAKSGEVLRIGMQRLVDLVHSRDPQGVRINYVFHIAHCGSTLLARALEIESQNLVYREPLALRQLGTEAASRFYGEAPPVAWRQKLDVALALLNRRYEGAGAVIVKANVPVNFMMSLLLEKTPANPALMLYSSLGDYLAAVLKSPQHRAWVASIFSELGMALEAMTGLTAAERRDLSVAEMAGCLWAVQLALFAKTAVEQPNTRTLDSELFYDRPGEAIAKAFEFFGHAVDESAIDGIAKSELFTRYSKDPRQAYDDATRRAQRDAAKAQLTEEIARARGWVRRHIDLLDLPERLDRPLTGETPLLMR